MFLEQRRDILLADLVQGGACQREHRRIAWRSCYDGVRPEAIAGPEAADLFLDSCLVGAARTDHPGLDDEDRVAGLTLLEHDLPIGDLPANQSRAQSFPLGRGQLSKKGGSFQDAHYPVT